jgi:serine/threonine protein kinase
LGKGGFGEVYRARDRKLKRDVAIKVLPDAFTSDLDRISRFQREAEVLASLNHPNIAAIYDIVTTETSQFLVLELVEGDTLAERLHRGPIPVDEALAIAVQIAEALEAAQGKGIIHRDLKPANIKVGLDGKVKVLDFGLAKILESASTAASISHSPTLISSPSTGTILGTAAYMSPEQARGRSVEGTSDVWAFGCVLYEILTGRQAFGGDTVGEVLAEIFKGEPDWSRLPAATPPGIRRLLRRCLQKDPARRLQHIGDARIEIEEAQAEPAAEAVHQSSPTRSSRAVLTSAVVVVGVIAVVLAMIVLRPTPTPGEIRLDISTPPTSDLAAFAISPDGKEVAYSASVDGQSRIWIRSLGSTDARPVRGTEQGSNPFWSPDGRSLGFFADGKLKRIDIAGGTPQVLANAPLKYGGSWNSSGVIIYTPGAAVPVFRISDQGGQPTPVTKLEPGKHSGHSWPQFLPDGNHLLFSISGTAESRGVYVVALDGSGQHRLTDADLAGEAFGMGHVFFVKQGTLFAQRLDLDRLELAGTPFAVAERIAIDNIFPALSAAVPGPIGYRTSGNALRQLTWFDRSGNRIGRVGEPDSESLQSVELSPDGRHAASVRNINGNQDVWVIELEKGVLDRFTFDPASDVNPVWSPDGRQIAFTSNRTGSYIIYKKAVGGGIETPLVEGPEGKSPTDWSRDGRFIVYRKAAPKTGFDLMAVPADGSSKPFPVVENSADAREGQFSPDGKWIAYQSNETGRTEIYVQSFPSPSGKRQISTEGGSQVRWPGDGKELFYLAADGRLMAVPIRTDPSGSSIEPGPAVALFRPSIVEAANSGYKQQFAVSRDGQRFLVNSPLQGGSPITLILNWQSKR